MSHRICKYHGRSCEYPGHCLNRAPRKYDTDGHMEHIDPDRLTLGNVLRWPHRDGSMTAFSDNVVIGIKVSYHHKRAAVERVDHRHFNTLADAIAHAKKDDYVYVLVARPYLYCSNAFGSMPGATMWAEKYEIPGDRILDTHKVVVQSTGEYASFMATPLLHKWEVVIKSANMDAWPKDGKVYDDLNEWGARESYKVHRAMAQGAYGRKGGETVTLLCDGEIVEEYVCNMGTEV